MCKTAYILCLYEKKVISDYINIGVQKVNIVNYFIDQLYVYIRA